MASGRTTGFDYLRLGLALAIVAVHSIDVSYGIAFSNALAKGPARPLVAMLLPMFFALSGFLVAGSLERCASLTSFAGLRIIRLAPALAFETLMAALVLGPLLTRLPLAEYVASPLLAGYFLNLLGDIHYLLPGMFETNPWPRTVNAQLWTVPYELACYIGLGGLAVLGVHRQRRTFVVIMVVTALALMAWHIARGMGVAWSAAPVAPGPAQVLAFFCGVGLYLYRDRVAHSPRLGLAAGAMAFGLFLHPAGDYLAAPFAAYLTVWLGLMRPRLASVVRRGDYSYGVFLFGFPIQQAATQLLGPAYHDWWWNLAAALPVTLLLAAVSWHAVEKPALTLRGPLRRFEQRRLESPADKWPPARS